MEEREIEKNPSVPNLNNRAIELLTQLCFRKNDRLEQVDLLFVFSTASYLQNVADYTAAILAQNIASKVFITGGVSRYIESQGIAKPESILVLERIPKDKSSNVQFFHEEKSQSTLENVTEALKVLDFREYSKVMFISKAHAAGRAYLTLKKYLPRMVISQQAYSVQYPDSDREITSENWHTFEFGKARVWGELIRIKKYGERGDIAYDEVRDVVEEIEMETR